jgi:hypothetical protein
MHELSGAHAHSDGLLGAAWEGAPGARARGADRTEHADGRQQVEDTESSAVAIEQSRASGRDHWGTRHIGSPAMSKRLTVMKTRMDPT